MGKIRAIVMASGFSTRMGKDKLIMKLHDKRIFEYILDTLSELDFDEVIVVTNNMNIRLYAEKLSMIVLSNSKSYLGQSESIKTGVSYGTEETAYMFFVADQPYLKRSTINKIMNNYFLNPHKIQIPLYSGVKGSPIIFPSWAKEKLLKLTGDKGGSAIINKDNSVTTEIENKLENMDIDNMEDYKELEGIGRHYYS